MELDGDVPRARDLEDAGRDVVVERDLTVGIVVRDHEVVPLTERHGALQVLARRDRGRRIVWVVQVDESRPPNHFGRDLLQLEQERGARRERVAVRLPARQPGPPFVHGVPRFRDDAHVRCVEQGHREVGDPLLGAEQRV